VNINPAMILHGEQVTEIFKPLPISGTFVGKSRISNLYDKGRGALLEMEVTINDAKTGEVYTKDVFGMFIRGAGNFGVSLHDGGMSILLHSPHLVLVQGDKGPATQNDNLPPQRAPDAVVEETTNVNQAQIFRLSGCGVLMACSCVSSGRL